MELKTGFNRIFTWNGELEVIRPIPKRLEKFWGFIFPHADLNSVLIAFKNKVYTNSPTITDDLIIHELEHLRQHNVIKILGWFWWLVFFILLPPLRYELELIAYREQLKYMKDNDRLSLAGIEEVARVMSSSMYQTRWERKLMIDFTTAYCALAAGITQISEN